MDLTWMRVNPLEERIRDALDTLHCDRRYIERELSQRLSDTELPAYKKYEEALVETNHLFTLLIKYSTALVSFVEGNRAESASASQATLNSHAIEPLNQALKFFKNILAHRIAQFKADFFVTLCRPVGWHLCAIFFAQNPELLEPTSPLKLSCCEAGSSRDGRVLITLSSPRDTISVQRNSLKEPLETIPGGRVLFDSKLQRYTLPSINQECFSPQGFGKFYVTVRTAFQKDVKNFDRIPEETFHVLGNVIRIYERETNPAKIAELRKFLHEQQEWSEEDFEAIDLMIWESQYRSGEEIEKTARWNVR